MKRTSRPVEQLRLTEKLYWIVQLYGSRLLKVILMCETLDQTKRWSRLQNIEQFDSVESCCLRWIPWYCALFGWERDRCKCTRLWQQYSFDDNMSQRPPGCCFLSSQTRRTHKSTGQRWTLVSSLCFETGSRSASLWVARFRSKTNTKS